MSEVIAEPTWRPMRQHSHKMENGIRDLCAFLPKNAVVVEIGCYAGESTKLFLESGKIKELICIDPWDNEYYKGGQLAPAEKNFDLVTKKYKKKVTKMKEMSGTALTKLIKSGKKIDAVYIDGNHTYPFVKGDIALSLQLIKEGDGGLICGHDYKYRKSPGVEKAVKELLQFPDVRFQDYSWIKFRDRVGQYDRTGVPHPDLK